MDRAFQRIRSLMLRGTFYSVPPSLGTSETELYLYGGNHPENVDPAHGTTIATKYIITCNGGKVIVNLCFEIKGAVSE